MVFISRFILMSRHNVLVLFFFQYLAWYTVIIPIADDVKNCLKILYLLYHSLKRKGMTLEQIYEHQSTILIRY